MQNKIWTDPKGYWFLNILTVHPTCQGQGVGKILANKVMHQADKDQYSCYLESSKLEPNIKIYEKLGFRMVDEMVIEEGEAKCTVCYQVF